jgi:hypothetical protein
MQYCVGKMSGTNSIREWILMIIYLFMYLFIYLDMYLFLEIEPLHMCDFCLFTDRLSLNFASTNGTKEVIPGQMEHFRRKISLSHISRLE